MSSSSRPRPSLRSALLRFLLMVAILLVAFFVFRETELIDRFTLERLGSLVETIRGWWWSPLALIAAWALLSPLGFPGTPFLVTAGLIFGPWWGTLYNWIGAVIGATTSYVFGRLLGHDLVAHVLGEERMERVERRLKHYGFWPLASLRLIPIPWPVINFGAALAGVPVGSFIASTALGMVPQVFVLTFFYASLGSLTTEQDQRAMWWMFAALVLLILLASVRFLMLRRAAPPVD